jgi:hypothetical protein
VDVWRLMLYEENADCGENMTSKKIKSAVKDNVEDRS